MDYDEDKIRSLIIAGLKLSEPWRVELEAINYGQQLGIFYRAADGVRRASVDTTGKTEDQIAFGLLMKLMNQPSLEEMTETTVAAETALKQATINAGLLSPYEGKRGKHPNSCACSKHRAVDGAQAS